MNLEPATITPSENALRGRKLAIWAIVFGLATGCFFPFGIVTLVLAYKAYNAMKDEPGAQPFLVIIALCVLPITGVAGIGCGAAIAIPAFQTYIKRAKTAETAANLGRLYDGVKTYADAHRDATGRPMLPAPLALTPSTPTRAKHSWPSDADPRWAELQFPFGSTPMYYSYAIEADEDVNALRLVAVGDLDEDGVQSRFELRVSVNENNEVVRAGAMVITNELE